MEFKVESTIVHRRDLHGPLHREDGPALIFRNGAKKWYFNGKKHRIDGPAETYPNGVRHWYINNMNVSIEVERWLVENNIRYPFDDAEIVQFKLRFAYDTNSKYC